MKKHCPGCNQNLTLINFAFKNKAKGTYQTYCNVCRKTIAKHSYERHKKNVVAAVQQRKKNVREKFREYKTSLKCIKCGEGESACLDFHHLDAKLKDFAVSQMYDQSWSMIKAEIDKCVVLCANCHRKVHVGKIVLQYYALVTQWTECLASNEEVAGPTPVEGSNFLWLTFWHKSKS